MPEASIYFRVPADTLYSLSIAYPYLSSTLKSQLLSYLAAYWQKYFATSKVRTIGWNSGTPREAMVYPPEVATRMTQIGDVAGGQMPQRVFYAAWRYAQLVPSQAASIYTAVRPLLVYPPPAPSTSSEDRASTTTTSSGTRASSISTIWPAPIRTRRSEPTSPASWPVCSTPG